LTQTSVADVDHTLLLILGHLVHLLFKANTTHKTAPTLVVKGETELT